MASFGLKYYQLPKRDKKLVENHILLSTELEYWYDVQTFLIKQVNKTKQSSEPITREAYNNYLLLGRDRMRSIDWINIFAHHLKIVLERDIESKFDCFFIYYGNENYGDDILEIASAVKKFDRNNWKLDSGPHLTIKDIHTITKFRNGLVGFLFKCMDIIEKSDTKHDPVKNRITIKCGLEVVRIMDVTGCDYYKC